MRYLTLRSTTTPAAFCPRSRRLVPPQTAASTSPGDWRARAARARQATLPKIWPAALALLTSLFVVASQAYAANDTLRIRLDADARSLDPGTNRDGNTDIVQTFLFEGLVAFREDATVGPMLAKSVELSPDEKTYTFVLRDGLAFSNGSPLTSADVLFAWQRYTDPKTGWRCLPEVDGHGAVKVTNVAAPDDKTVVFTLEKPSALFLATLARPDCGQT